MHFKPLMCPINLFPIGISPAINPSYDLSEAFAYMYLKATVRTLILRIFYSVLPPLAKFWDMHYIIEVQN